MKTLWILAGSILLPAASQGQDTPAPPASAVAARPTPLVERLRTQDLRVLPGPVATHHAAGFEEKAGRLRAQIEAALAFYQQRLGVELPLHLAVLTRPQWDALIPWQPYGIPGVAGRPAVIFMPAGDDGLAAQDALALKARVKPATLALLAGSGHSFDEAALRYVDLVGLHELGHALTRALGIAAPGRWLDEWLATYVAYAYLREQAPAQALLWEGMLQAYLDAVTPTYRTLADFERLYFGVGANNYVWYQAQFQRGVAQAYDAHGLRLLTTMRELFPARAPGAAPANLTPAALIDALEPRLPGFRAWAAGFESVAPR